MFYYVPQGLSDASFFKSTGIEESELYWAVLLVLFLSLMKMFDQRTQQIQFTASESLKWGMVFLSSVEVLCNTFSL